MFMWSFGALRFQVGLGEMTEISEKSPILEDQMTWPIYHIGITILLTTKATIFVGSNIIKLYTEITGNLQT